MKYMGFHYRYKFLDKDKSYTNTFVKLFFTNKSLEPIFSNIFTYVDSPIFFFNFVHLIFDLTKNLKMIWLKLHNFGKVIGYDT